MKAFIPPSTLLVHGGAPGHPWERPWGGENVELTVFETERNGRKVCKKKAIPCIFSNIYLVSAESESISALDRAVSVEGGIIERWWSKRFLAKSGRKKHFVWVKTYYRCRKSEENINDCTEEYYTVKVVFDKFDKNVLKVSRFYKLNNKVSLRSYLENVIENMVV